MKSPVLNSRSLPALATQAVLWTLASSVGAVALAQEPEVGPETELGPETEEGAEAPARLARLALMQGGVSLQAVGETEWVPATLNRPMAPGDYLRTDPTGRAEVQLEEAAVRLNNDTNFSFVSLDDRALRMRLTSGTLNVRVRGLGENDSIEIETPQATASILRPGNYRLEVSPMSGTTVAKVSSGWMEMSGGGESVIVRAQQTARLTGTGRFAYTTGTLGAPDTFDEWSLDRDQEIDGVLSTESSKYVSRDTVGYEELDRYGEWRSEPEYGHVWTPRVIAGWSPYSFGRYSYVSGWGWTWIDDAPWGFAPFHYGNWVTIGGRWCWVPGSRHHRRPIGRPNFAGDRWHIPSTPRGYTTRSFPRDGSSNSFNRDGDWARDRNERWRNGDNRRDGNSRWRTQPDGDRYRYVRPDRNQMPPSRTPDVVGSPSSVPPANDRRMRVPRDPRMDMPRNTFPRNDSGSGRGPTMSSSPRREVPRQEAPRPSAPPAQQPQSQRSDSPRPTFSRGGDSAGSRPRPRER